METASFLSPVSPWLLPAQVLFALIQLIGFACFVYIVRKRLAPMLAAERDPRFDRVWQRVQTGCT